jgi:predicted deacylase
MEIRKRGEGEPEYTVIGSLHGDEPAGRDAIEKFLQDSREFHRPVQFIVANEEALEQDERFIDSDLNRVFPGDPDSDSHEERLASKIMKEVEGTKVLDLHTTHSYPLPFATFTEKSPEVKDLLESTGVEHAVLFRNGAGTLHQEVEGVVVETGHQKTEMAVHNAVGVIANFLASQGVIDAGFHRSDPDVYVSQEKVEGDWEFLAENFHEVSSGEVYARNGDSELRAEEDFYPVLMSTNGYDGHLGFKARRED